MDFLLPMRIFEKLQICIRLCIECAVNIFMIDVSQKELDKHPG
jgi:hypothetical protein